LKVSAKEKYCKALKARKERRDHDGETRKKKGQCATISPP
jgi:hypothetical protein